MIKTQCPVCQKTDERVQLIYVPLGHGRYCKYICCECLVVFPWGSNKFGDITKIEQIEKVRWVANIVNADKDKEDMILPSEHPNYRKRI